MASICPRCKKLPAQQSVLWSAAIASIPRAKRQSVAEWQKRSFSVQPSRRATSVLKPKIPARGSPGVEFRKLQAQALREGHNIPEEIGLLPQTFIYPTTRGLRWNVDLRKTWLRVRAGEILASLWAWWTLRPRPRFEIRKTTRVAADLHKQMYEALASGDTKGLEGKMSAGLLASLNKRIREREKGITMSWSCEAVRRPHMPSFRIVMPPGQVAPRDKRSGVYQAVVKLDTKQTLQKHKEMSEPGQGSGKENKTLVADGNPVTKRVCEYVVIQRFLKAGTLGPWKLWGFTQESNLTDFQAEMRRTAKLSQQQATLTAKR